MLSVGGVHKTKLVHHLVLITFVGERPEGAECCHNQNNPSNNNLVNLRWDTHLANVLDKEKHGTVYQRHKLACPRKHLLRAPNLVKVKWERDGWRECLACHRAEGNCRYARKQGRALDFKAVANRHYAEIMAGLPAG